MRRLTALSWLCLVLVAASGCGDSPPPPPAGPAAAAIHLFDAARPPDADEDVLLGLFDPDSVDEERVALLETLDGLTGNPGVTVADVLQPDPQEAFVDLVTELDGGGSAEYTVRLRADGDRWLVNWVQGPGLEWPRRRGRGDGLSTSSEP